MTYIEVDGEVLRDTGARLTEAVSVAEQVRGSRDALRSSAPDFGHGGLAGAVGEFVERWSYGTEVLEDDARTLARLLTESGRVYVEVDTGIAGQCGDG